MEVQQEVWQHRELQRCAHAVLAFDPHWNAACGSMQILSVPAAIVAMEVALRAGHVGMLPPKASSKMFTGLEAKFRIPIETSKEVPEILGLAIRGLP